LNYSVQIHDYIEVSLIMLLKKISEQDPRSLGFLNSLTVTQSHGSSVSASSMAVSDAANLQRLPPGFNLDASNRCLYFSNSRQRALGQVKTLAIADFQLQLL